MGTIVSFENTGLGDQDAPIGDLGGDEYRLAQSFTMPYTTSVDGVQLYLKKVNSISSAITVRIETDNSNVPSGTLAHVNATNTVTPSNTSYEWKTVSYTPFSLTSGVKYWIVTALANQANNDYYAWYRDNGNGYSGGSDANTFNGGAWAANAGSDLFFIVNYTIPSGGSPMLFGGGVTIG